MIPYQVIRAKRDGEELDEQIISAFISAYVDGEIPDYQMSAFLMSVYFKGMTAAETVALTKSYIVSGETMNFRDFDFPTSDKHSTGGVGDKISLVLAPLVASCGVGVPMISGRGLGHTGGTLDKLESIPNFSTNLTSQMCEDMLKKNKLFIAAQTGTMVPADKKIYALRDVTATVESIPLIVASIMSKKLAEGTGSLVLDVKFGNGAFMKNVEDARTLSKAMVDVGNLYGVPTVALLTNMNQPLGEYVGNSLEVRESIEYLRGDIRPQDLNEITMALGSVMLVLSGIANNISDGKKILEQKLESGKALEKFREFIIAQGGEPDVVDNVNILPASPIAREVFAPLDGYISGFDTLGIGMLGVEMGAGRTRIDDIIDPRVGFRFLAKTGDYVRKGEPVAIVFGSDIDQTINSVQKIAESIKYSAEPVEKPKNIEFIIKEKIESFDWNAKIE
ncbi:thymidine phosphorylase [bacterium]|nr:thymidine phosphorylase [bacterium]